MSSNRATPQGPRASCCCRLPYVALSKTYNANQQTSDFAPTATAMVAGKTNDGAISVGEDIERNEKGGAVIASRAVQTILEQAEAKGLSTGIVTTARVTNIAHGPQQVNNGEPAPAREIRALASWASA